MAGRVLAKHDQVVNPDRGVRESRRQQPKASVVIRADVTAIAWAIVTSLVVIPISEDEASMVTAESTEPAKAMTAETVSSKAAPTAEAPAEPVTAPEAASMEATAKSAAATN